MIFNCKNSGNIRAVNISQYTIHIFTLIGCGTQATIPSILAAVAISIA
jgi:hypothetical protein